MKRSALLGLKLGTPPGMEKWDTSVLLPMMSATLASRQVWLPPAQNPMRAAPIPTLAGWSMVMLV